MPHALVALLLTIIFVPARAFGFDVHMLDADFPFEVTIPGNRSAVKGIFHSASGTL